MFRALTFSIRRNANSEVLKMSPPLNFTEAILDPVVRNPSCSNTLFHITL